MIKSSRNPKNLEENKIEKNGNADSYLKIGSISLKNIFEGITKRIQCQTIGKIIAQSNKELTKNNRIKLIVCVAQRCLRQKKQKALNRLKVQSILQVVSSKGAKSLALTMRRISKNLLGFALGKLRERESSNRVENKKSERESIKSSRRSSSSNVLSVSEDSMLSSRILPNHENQQEQLLKLRRENEELKRMVLSDEIREGLMKLQRFDRYIYNIQSQKYLREPIAAELRRLEKMKNQFKEMRSKFYDNQLTVTCLFNHVKLVAEMNRELGDCNALKAKIVELENKMAETNAQHRKQVSEFKRKLLFFDAGSIDKGSSKDISIQSKATTTSAESKSSEFSNEELTTYNIIVSTLKNKKYKDTRREIDYFTKKSKKQTYIVIFKQVLALIEDLQASSQLTKTNEKSKLDTIASLAQFDKYLRNEQLDELQKLKNKCKAQSAPIQIVQLFESVIALYTEARKLRKKDSSSVDKDIKSAEKEKQKRNVQTENEELRKTVKNLQIQIEELETEKLKLEENIKKLERSRPSLPPRRPASIERDLSSQSKSQSTKKPQDEIKLQRQIDQLSKELTQISQKYRQFEQNQAVKFANLQEECSRMKSQEKGLRLRLKQFEDGNRCYSTIMQKKEQKQNYIKDLNDFKRAYPESIFTVFFSLIQSEESSSQANLTQLKNIVSLFSDNSWRRRTNFQLKEENQVNDCLNALIQILYSIHQKRDQQNKALEDLKKREAASSDEATRLKDEIGKGKAQITRLREESAKSRESFSKAKEENNLIKSQIAKLQSSQTKKTPEKISRESSIQDSNSASLLNNLKQVSSLFSQNGWKRRANIIFKQEGEAYIYLNQITQKLMNLSKEREENTKTIANISEENRQLKNELKRHIDHLQEMTNSNKIILSIDEGSNTQLQMELSELKQGNQRLSLQLDQLTLQNQELISKLSKEKSESSSPKRENSKQNRRISYEKGTREEEKPNKQQETRVIKDERQRLSSKNIGKEDSASYQTRLSDYESKLINSEEKLANYKFLFQKAKKERDNLILLLEQKNEQYQLCKENEEKYELIKRSDEEKIVELKHSYESNELEVRKIENEVERLLQEREVMITEKIVYQERMNELIQLKDQQIEELKLLLRDQESIAQQLQFQISQEKCKSEFDILTFEQEKSYLNKSLKNLEEENNRNRMKFESELQEYRSKCERYGTQLTQSKEDFSIERELLRQKISQFTKLSQSLPSNVPSEDHQKQQLRKQLDLINEELASILRSNEQEKREQRRYIEQLISEGQMQNSVYNEQKRILREDIERARSEEYAINQEKIKKLREDIQALRSENERLTFIIDSNQTSFNQLISEHKNMRDGIAQLQEHNAHLEQLIQQSEIEKLELMQKLESLEEKLTDFESKITFAMNEGQQKEEEILKNSQSRIAQLQQEYHHACEERQFLSLKNSEQARQLIEMQHELIRLQAQLNSYASAQPEPKQVKTKNSEYSKYLQEKLESNESEMKRYIQNEREMMKKIQASIRRINELEMEKHQHQTMKRDYDLRLTLNRAESERELLRMQERLTQLESLLKSKEQEINDMKINDSTHSFNELQAKLQQLESERHRTLLENNRFKMTIEEQNRTRNILEQKVEETQKLILQNKRLTNKIAMVEEQTKLVQSKYLESQSQVFLIENKLQQDSFDRTLSVHGSLTGLNSDKSIKQELQWCKEQLKSKEDEINQHRIKEYHLSASLKRSEEMIDQFLQKEERFYRDGYLLEESRAKLRNLEDLVNNERDSRRMADANYHSQLSERNQEINILKLRLQELSETNNQLEAKLESVSKYEHDFLFEIARQLDQNYEIEGEEEEIEIRILQKISQQISELVQMNTRIQTKCELLEKGHHSSNVEANLSASIRYMLHDFLAYLNNNHLINPEQIPVLPQEASAEKLISELGLLLKDLFCSSARHSEQEIAKYNNLVGEIKQAIDDFCQHSNLESLNKLRGIFAN